MSSHDPALTGNFASIVSATLHLASEEPLFKRLISLSGTFLVLKPLPAAAHENFYQEVLNALGIQDLDAAGQVEVLEKLDVAELLTKLPPSIPAAPLLDGTFCVEEPTFAALREKKRVPELIQNWCSDLLIGDCALDVCVDPSLTQFTIVHTDDWLTILSS